MVLKWTIEEKTLLNMKKVIAKAWRMNSQQLCSYCANLRKSRTEILPGQLGKKFLEQLDLVSDGKIDRAA